MPSKALDVERTMFSRMLPEERESGAKPKWVAVHRAAYERPISYQKQIDRASCASSSGHASECLHCFYSDIDEIKRILVFPNKEKIDTDKSKQLYMKPEAQKPTDSLYSVSSGVWHSAALASRRAGVACTPTRVPGTSRVVTTKFELSMWVQKREIWRRFSSMKAYLRAECELSRCMYCTVSTLG